MALWPSHSEDIPSRECRWRQLPLALRAHLEAEPLLAPLCEKHLSPHSTLLVSPLHLPCGSRSHSHVVAQGGAVPSEAPAVLPSQPWEAESSSSNRDIVFYWVPNWEVAFDFFQRRSVLCLVSFLPTLKSGSWRGAGSTPAPPPSLLWALCPTSPLLGRPSAPGVAV